MFVVTSEEVLNIYELEYIMHRAMSEFGSYIFMVKTVSTFVYIPEAIIVDTLECTQINKDALTSVIHDHVSFLSRPSHMTVA